MNHYLLFTLALSLLFSNKVLSQSCDCDIFPIKNDCKKECGIKLLRIGTKAQLKNSLKLKDETLEKIVSVPNRETKKSVEDFRKSMPEKDYENLKTRFDKWVSAPSVNQHNTYGDNVAGDKNVTNNNYIKADPFLLKNSNNAEREDFLLPQLKGGPYCSEYDDVSDSDGNISLIMFSESIGEKGRIDHISDTINTKQYNYSMYLNPNVSGGWGMGKKSTVFNSGDLLKFFIRTKDLHMSFDIHFLNAEGTRYYQRATWTKGTGCGAGGVYILSFPIKKK